MSIWSTPERNAAIQKVIDLLKVYDGEPVNKGEHPLHAAVVELEALVDNKLEFKDDGHIQNHLLPSACNSWFKLLWTSRGVDHHSKLAGHACPPDPNEAKSWAYDLRRQLEFWLEAEPEEWARRARQMESRRAEHNEGAL